MSALIKVTFIAVAFVIKPVLFFSIPPKYSITSMLYGSEINLLFKSASNAASSANPLITEDTLSRSQLLSGIHKLRMVNSAQRFSHRSDFLQRSV